MFVTKEGLYNYNNELVLFLKGWVKLGEASIINTIN